MKIPRMVWMVGLLLAGLVVTASVSYAQDAGVSGQITDGQGRAIPGVTVVLTNLNTGVTHEAKTNGDGIYNAPALPPGLYRANVTKDGFKSIVKGDIELHVQDQASINFQLQIGSVNETVTVEAGGLNINTTDAAVSTVVDQQFIENIPLNGRTMQNLIYLTPGVVITPTSANDLGQFSVNGQRTDANYFTIDGASANVGTTSPNSAQLGQAAAGSVPGLSVLGGTNNLVSMDAMQEFRIQTSSYAPEFGRTPGGQISVLTRSGTNNWHGTAFEYIRNDLFDANDWFSDKAGLHKSEERQNDFGGVLGAPIIKDRTFFFFSYEGLRLRLPQTGTTSVPSMAARSSAPAALQPFFDAFPQPNGADQGNGLAAFDAGYSDSAALDAVSLRVDHTIRNTLHLFGRYNYAPSSLDQRGGGGSYALSVVASQKFNTQTATAGATWTFTPSLTNDFRFNYSHNSASTVNRLDTFGGAVPVPNEALFPSPFSTSNGHVNIYVLSGTQTLLGIGSLGRNLQRQFNFVDNISFARGKHSLKFGVDYRRLSPEYTPPAYEQFNNFLSVGDLSAGTLLFGEVAASRAGTILFHNIGAFAQDTWQALPRLTLTYGIRWDADFSPSSGTAGITLLAVTGFDNLSNLAIAPLGAPLFHTTYGNFAPRLGVAYSLRRAPGRQTVVRAGFGVFYDLASQKIGDALVQSYPFTGVNSFASGTTFPLSPQNAAPPPIQLIFPLGGLTASDPNLKLPYTLEWNVAVQQALGGSQAVTMSYVGSTGRRLIVQEQLTNLPNSEFTGAGIQLLRNGQTSDYDALQVQYNRVLNQGLQALASFTFSHCIDTGSTDSSASTVTFTRGINENVNRGACDFDIRKSLATGITYNIPSPRVMKVVAEITKNWSIDSEVIARSAPPVDIVDYNFFRTIGASPSSILYIRPDLVPGQPLYLFGPQYPGRKAINPNAFTDPPTDAASGLPLRQGDVGRNSLRGYGATQWDFAVHRSFSFKEGIRLEFRSEFFNLLNHPNFGQPQSAFTTPISPSFGQSIATLGRSLSNDSQGLNPLYQIGGPRSIQFALRLTF